LLAKHAAHIKSWHEITLETQRKHAVHCTPLSEKGNNVEKRGQFTFSFRKLQLVDENGLLQLGVDLILEALTKKNANPQCGVRKCGKARGTLTLQSPTRRPMPASGEGAHPPGQAKTGCRRKERGIAPGGADSGRRGGRRTRRGIRRR
jgi:hypothetical protein